MYGGRDHRQCAKALADPDAQHVQLEERVVDGFAAVHVHEEVVEEAAAPGRHGAQDVTPGEEAVVVPHEFGRHRRQNIYNRDACKGLNLLLFIWIDRVG